MKIQKNLIIILSLIIFLPFLSKNVDAKCVDNNMFVSDENYAFSKNESFLVDSNEVQINNNKLNIEKATSSKNKKSQ